LLEKAIKSYDIDEGF